MKRILIIGFGLSGRAAALWALSSGYEVVAIDAKSAMLQSNQEVKELLKRGVKLLDMEAVLQIHDFDFAISSPGVPASHPVFERLLGLQIFAEVEFAFMHLPQKIVGISGTNGKTTVTLMIEHLLNACGKKARAFGNVGVPLIEAIASASPDEILVVELSSYQLEMLKKPVLDAAVLLNITPDHLDRYQTMENYADAKLKLQTITKEKSCFFIEANTYSAYGKGKEAVCYGYDPSSEWHTDLNSLYHFDKKWMDLPIPLQKRRSHDLENFIAASLLCFTLGVRPEAIASAYSSFKKPEHRIEFVIEKEGVKFFDDSKGTNIDAVIRAVEVMKGPVYLIAGGVDKGAPYTSWKQAFQSKVQRVFAIGESASKIQKDLMPQIPVEICSGLEEAVLKAKKYALSGDNILLSPGCSSFDMFIDYEHRGQIFQSIVCNLSNKN